MNKILLLGGTGDAIRIANFCHTSLRDASNTKGRLELVYSLAGVARTAKLGCETRVGGFGGWRGLLDFVIEHAVDLILDVTHPYASTMKKNAQKACAEAEVPLYRFVRPAWIKSSQDQWIPAASMVGVLPLLKDYHRVFFTVGRSAFKLLSAKQQQPYSKQRWYIRYVPSPHQRIPTLTDNLTLIKTIGPFDYDNELTFLQANKIDVLISKNSGGESVSAKIQAARVCDIPVIMLNRPNVIQIKHQHDHLATLEAAISSFISDY